MFITPQKNWRTWDVHTVSANYTFLKNIFFFNGEHFIDNIKFPQIVNIFPLNTTISDNKSLINGKYNSKPNTKFFSCGHQHHSAEKAV